MKAIQARSKAVDELRDAINDWAAAVEARDIDALLKHYTDDVRVFDVPMPEQIRGKENYRKNWESFLGRIEGSNLRISGDGNIRQRRTWFYPYVDEYSRSRA